MGRRQLPKHGRRIQHRDNLAGAIDAFIDLEAVGPADDRLWFAIKQVIDAAAGSAFKPYTLAAALESGDLQGRPVTLNSYWDRSRPAVIDCGFPCSSRGNIWVVDAGLSSPHQLATLESATVSSLNPVYARLIAAIGAEPVVDMARRLGIRTSEVKPVYAVTLGAASVSPLEMASAYSTFANQGNYLEPYLIERITDSSGNVISAKMRIGVRLTGVFPHRRWQSMGSSLCMLAAAVIKDCSLTMIVYDSSSSPLDNYREHVLLRMRVNTELVPQYPERFAAVCADYAKQLADIEQKMSALEEGG